jgi:hypothetical protein
MQEVELLEETSKYKKTPRSKAFSNPSKSQFARKSLAYKRKFLSELNDMVEDGSLIPESQKSKQNQE